MEDILTSIDQKLSIVIYCLIGFLLLAAIRSYFQIRTFTKVNSRDAESDYYVDLLRKEHYQAVIDHADKSLKTDPNDVYAHWYKAKTLYKLEKYEEARDLFDRVKTIEPDWIDSAQPYIRRIDKMAQEGED